jgi:hypothetical protein
VAFGLMPREGAESIGVADSLSLWLAQIAVCGLSSANASGGPPLFFSRADS